ncbi:MAG: class I SAM-dependent methyltransferase [Acidobacteriia bacterium]|nr:class I SAM-dependent methyltransferase [Terriglobia bacterium]MBV9743963.1 class I SAM-dependent methyltransferase [Terriglobia bacterium]
MKSPIIFQPLEDELRPVLKYFNGRVLNAGCGERDISGILKRNGATAVDACDRRSSIPGAIICDLVDVPRQDESYDSILCNAVLEHVQFPDRVMQEFYRLLKPTGWLVISVPFLQPYHPKPDFRRYSREGMLELARLHGFEVVELLPVHTIAQTVTWIAWSYLGEKHNHLLQAALWLPFYCWNRLSHKTDFNCIDQANSYQMVLRKTEQHRVNGANGSHRLPV